MNKFIHLCWIQGADQLPAEYKANVQRWKAAFPDRTVLVWDNAMACERWVDYRHVQETCSHHAMRADLILARALRDFGGLATGTDVVLLNPAPLASWLMNNDTLLIVNPCDHACSNALVAMPEGHPFISAVCEDQWANLSKFHLPQVQMITGPGLYYQVFRQRHWALAMVTDTLIYDHLWGQPVHNPNAWVNPGYAASWHPKKS